MKDKIKFGLPIKTINSIKKIFSKYSKIKKIIIYGSRAKGTFKKGSDIDLTLIAPKLTLKELFKIENEIDDLLIPYKVDLSLYHKIENKEVLKHVARLGKEF